MCAMTSQITSLTIVYSTVYSCADQRKHQSSALLAFVRGNHRGPVNSPHKCPVSRKMFPFDDVIMSMLILLTDFFNAICDQYECVVGIGPTETGSASPPESSCGAVGWVLFGDSDNRNGVCLNPSDGSCMQRSKRWYQILVHTRFSFVDFIYGFVLLWNFRAFVVD